ncbi:MAG TPA: ATP-binding protein [Jiangellales bacterium]|nr:ATP-binding protein [Jiangellales bacterium]
MDWFLDPSRTGVTADLRSELGEYLRRHAQDDAEVDSALLAVEELVANAVRHSTTPTWVTTDWHGDELVVSVLDLGPGFELDSVALPDVDSESGRGLFIVAALSTDLQAVRRRAGGARVSARLPLRRSGSRDLDPLPRTASPLPTLGEAGPAGFGKESFLRALVVQMAQAVEAADGPAAAEAAVASVGSTVGGQMEEEYRRASGVVGRLAPEDLARCYVRLKAAIDGGFEAVEVGEDRIVLVNTACPFGAAVQHAPALCRMTSSVFGGIAARAAGEATVVLEERIAVGDPGCRVVVHLGPAPMEAARVGHRYRRPPEDEPHRATAGGTTAGRDRPAHRG